MHAYLVVVITEKKSKKHNPRRTDRMDGRWFARM